MGESLLVTMTYTGPDTTDLGHLLRKHPATVQTIETSVVEAHVFYPEAESRCCLPRRLCERPTLRVILHDSGGPGTAVAHGHDWAL